MDLTLYIDFKSPAAYLAIQPTLQRVATHPGTNLVLLPFETRQRPVPKAKSAETRSESHFRVRAEARQASHLYYAGVQGIPMHFRDDPGTTTLALAGMLYCQDDPLAYSYAAFRSYWTTDADLNDPDVVSSFITEAGHDAGEFNPDTAISRLSATQEEAEAKGVIDTPAYVIDDQLFIGREHLPWIESLLRN